MELLQIIPTFASVIENMMEREMVIGRLKEFGLGITQPRIDILSYLMENHIHPTVDTIYSELVKIHPGLSRTTVYNTVQTLTKCGALRTLCIDDAHVNIDENTRPHAHLLCRECGRIIDLPLKGISEEKAAHPFSMDGNMIEEVHQYYRGVCQECRNK